MCAGVSLNPGKEVKLITVHVLFHLLTGLPLHFHFIPSSPGGQPVCKNRRAFILSPCTNRFLRFCFYILIIVDFIKKWSLPGRQFPAPRPAYLYCNILPVHLYVLGEEPRATAERLSLCGFQKFMFFNVKESPDALLLSTRLAMHFLTYCH